MSRRIELRKRQLRGDDSLLRKRDDKQIGCATEFRLRKKKKKERFRCETNVNRDNSDEERHSRNTHPRLHRGFQCFERSPNITASRTASSCCRNSITSLSIFPTEPVETIFLPSPTSV